jgi:GST-like protein
MIDLYLAPTRNGFRASIALAECGLDYRAHRVDIAKDEQKTSRHLAISPFGRVPAIIDHDGPGGKPLRLFQSGAIALYAAEKSGRFMPADPATRYEMMAWFLTAVTDVAATSTAILHVGSEVPDRTAGNLAFFERRFVDLARVLNARLADRPYLLGEATIADFAHYPVVAHRRSVVEKAGDFPHLWRWIELLAARPGVVKGMAPF